MRKVKVSPEVVTIPSGLSHQLRVSGFQPVANRVLKSVLVAGAVLAASSANLCRADHEKDGKEPTPKSETKSRTPSRGITIDIGRFSRFAPGIHIQVGPKSNRRRPVHVDVQRHGYGGVHVDVGAQGPGAIDLPPLPARSRENFIGVFTSPVPEAVAVQLPNAPKDGRGLLVTKVVPSSPAAKSGVKVNDILKSYNGQKLSSTEQLKKLVVGDKPAGNVNLGILRAGKSQVLEVTLAERDVPNTPRTAPHFIPPQPLPDDRGARIIEIDGLPPIIISKDFIQAPGVQIHLDRLRTPREARRRTRIETRAVRVFRRDGKSYTVEVKYVDENGNKNAHVFAGTRKEIKGGIDKLPQDLQDDVRRNLDKLGDEKKSNQAIQFRLQPRFDGSRRSVRIFLRRPDKNGRSRIVEIHRPLEDGRTAELVESLKVDIFGEEMQELSPEIRQKVEATLKKTPVPQVRIDVAKSQ